MLLERANLLHWDALVYLEMFVAGIAAGAYAVAALLELIGRGRSPLARSAHLLAFPLMLLAGVLLIVDLQRPERFWHMLLQATSLLPMWKPWSPMSLGSWLVLTFSAFAFVSFVDALVARGALSLGGWRADRTLHGSPLGLGWALIGGGLAFAVTAYSGMLLNVTNIPGWGHSSLIAPLFVATALATGLAALLLVRVVAARGDDADLAALARASAWLVAWWLVVFVAFVITLGPGAAFFLRGTPLIAFGGAALVGGIVPLLLTFRWARASRAYLAAYAVLVLLGGLLLRYAIVMGPQLLS